MTAAHTISLFNSNADMTAALVNDACFALDAPNAKRFYYRAAAALAIFMRRSGRSSWLGKTLTWRWSMSVGLMKMMRAPMPLW